MSVYLQFADGSIGECLDPQLLYRECLSQPNALPTEPWFGKANRIEWTLTCRPARGMLLVRYHTILKAKQHKYQAHLCFTENHQERAIYKDILLIRYGFVNKTGLPDGNPEHERSVCWVEISDQRYRWRHAEPHDFVYNLRKKPGGAYDPATLKMGLPWTWNEILTDIWQKVKGSNSVILEAPMDEIHEPPEGFELYQWVPSVALDYVLQRLNCALRIDPASGYTEVVHLGRGNIQTRALLEGLRRNYALLLPDPGGTSAAGVDKIRVLFRKEPAPTNATSPYYAIDFDVVTQRLRSNAQPPQWAILHDDLPARYIDGVLQNPATLQARAEERADEYEARLVYASQPKAAVCAGTHGNFFHHILSSLVPQIAHQDLGNGVQFHYHAGPDALPKLEEWAPHDPGFEITIVEDVCPYDSTGSGGGDTPIYQNDIIDGGTF